MLSDMPGISEEEKRRLLHCIVVGGVPTGVEFSGELSDFIINDVHQRYSHVKDYIHVNLIEEDLHPFFSLPKVINELFYLATMLFDIIIDPTDGEAPVKFY